MASITLTVNGASQTIDVEPDMPATNAVGSIGDIGSGARAEHVVAWQQRHRAAGTGARQDLEYGSPGGLGCRRGEAHLVAFT